MNNIKIEYSRGSSDTTNFYNTISDIIFNAVDKIIEARKLCDDSDEEMGEFEISVITEGFRQDLCNQILGYDPKEEDEEDGD